jgi:hypothetical protein
MITPDYAQLADEKARVCCVKYMRSVVNNQMVIGYTVRLNSARANGNIFLRSPPEYVINMRENV